MKVNVEDISSVKKKLLIEIPKEDVIKETDKFFNKLRKTVNLKGFRTGKIPRSVLENRFRKEAASEIGAELVNISYSQAVEENNLVPLGVPEFDYPEVVSGQDYKYTTTIEVKPLVSIKDYTGLKLKKSVYKVTDDKIEEKLQKLQKNLAQMRTIDEERPVTNGDFVQIDYEGFKDDKPFPPAGKSENYVGEIGSGTLLKEMSDELVGMTRGETKTFPVKFSDDYVPKALAGHEVFFTVTLKEIKNQILPDINDDFAKDLGEFSNLEELKSAIREEMERNYDNFSEKQLYEQVIDNLIEKTDFDLPEVLVNHEVNQMAEHAENSFGSQGISLKDMGYTHDDFLSKYRPAAERKVRGLLTLGKIIEQEGFVINDEILNKGFEILSKRLGQPLESIKMVYKQDKERAAGFEENFLEEHAVAYIIANSAVEEVEAGGDEKDKADDIK